MRSAPGSQAHKVVSEERAALTPAKLAMDRRLAVIAPLYTHRFVLERHYNTAPHHSGTLMRYFFSLPCSAAALSLSIVVAATAAASVTLRRTAL